MRLIIFFYLTSVSIASSPLSLQFHSCIPVVVIFHLSRAGSLLAWWSHWPPEISVYYKLTSNSLNEILFLWLPNGDESSNLCGLSIGFTLTGLCLHSHWIPNVKLDSQFHLTPQCQVSEPLSVCFSLESPIGLFHLLSIFQTPSLSDCLDPLLHIPFSTSSQEKDTFSCT